MLQLRIIEVVDSRNVSTFYPEHKVLGFWWWRWETYPCGAIEFETLEEATNWICYKCKVKQIVHNINCEEL